MEIDQKSNMPRWILIGTGLFGLLAAGSVLIVRYYEIQKARAEAAQAQRVEIQFPDKFGPSSTTTSRSPIDYKIDPKEAATSKVSVGKKDPFSEIDLLTEIDTFGKSTSGPWKRDGKAVISPIFREWPQNSWILLSRPPSESYRLTLEVERLEEGQGLNIGLVVRGGRCAAIVDGFAGSGGASGLEMIDGRSGKENDTSRFGKRLPKGEKKTLVLEVRGRSITMNCENERLIDWSGSPNRLSLHLTWPVPDSGRLFLGTQAKFRFTKAVVVALE